MAKKTRNPRELMRSKDYQEDAQVARVLAVLPGTVTGLAFAVSAPGWISWPLLGVFTLAAVLAISFFTSAIEAGAGFCGPLEALEHKTKEVQRIAKTELFKDEESIQRLAADTANVYAEASALLASRPSHERLSGYAHDVEGFSDMEAAITEAHAMVVDYEKTAARAQAQGSTSLRSLRSSISAAEAEKRVTIKAMEEVKKLHRELI